MSVSDNVDRRYPWRIPTAERIKTSLGAHRLKVWGFVIYRCDYQKENEVAWTRLLEALEKLRTEHVQDAEVEQQLDWSIQEDPALAGATHDEVRRRFKRWVSNEGRQEFPSEISPEQESNLLNQVPRYNFCLYVGGENLKTLQKTRDEFPYRRPQPTLDLIRADADWTYPDFDRFDWSQYQPPPEDEDDDEGENFDFDEHEKEIEGSRMYDVGWTRVDLNSLIGDGYLTLDKPYAWDSLYRRPNA